MFAPKVAKAQTKAAKSPTSKLAPQRSTLMGHRLSHDPAKQVLLLQRTIGNQATLRLLAQRARSLTGKDPGGDHEQEAAPENTTAREVPRTIAWDLSKIPAFPPDRAEQYPLSLPQLSSPGTLTTAEAIHQATVENHSAAPPTPATLFATMVQVRMRNDASADRSARLLRAQAFAFGNQVLFRRGCYEPETERGRALIAHELTHVTHQSQTGHFRPQRFVGGDVLSVQFTRSMAEDMEDNELYQQMNILRSHLKEKPDDSGAAENLAVLESVAYSRQGIAGETPAPTAAPHRRATATERQLCLAPFDHYLARKLINNYMDASGKTIILSEQEMIDCNPEIDLHNSDKLWKEVFRLAKLGGTLPLQSHADWPALWETLRSLEDQRQPYMERKRCSGPTLSRAAGLG